MVKKQITTVERLKKFLDKRKMLQRDFAYAIGCPESTVSRWLTGTHKMLRVMENVVNDQIDQFEAINGTRDHK